MTDKKKITLSNVFKKAGLEVLTYVNKNDLVENEVVFCVLKAELIDVPNSKFDIKEQWNLTVAVPTEDDTVRKFWLTFTPNEVRNDFMTAIKNALEEAHKQGMKAVHSCVLQAVPTAKYDNPFFVINFTDRDCHCAIDE